MFNKINILLVVIITKSIINAQCYDYELAVSDFPFDHLADFTADEDVGINWGLQSIGGAGGNDFAYKVTLLEPALIYVTTCDSDTDVDVEIGIFNSCDTTDWILFQDDSQTPVYYPDGTSEQYEFQCISGFETNPYYANMLPLLEWEAGTYYVVVGDRGGFGTVRTYIGYSLLVDSTTTNDDYSEINYHFSEGVFGGEYQDVYVGNGIPLEISDYSLSINSNGGDANEAYITSLATLIGDPISINESDIRVNIDYPDIPSGVEEVTIGPASVSSIFNSIGIPLLNVDGITILLEDALRPIITTTLPTNNAEQVPENSNINLTFSEEVFFNNGAINNENASNCFNLEVLNTGEEIGYVLSNSANSTFTLNPENNLPEYAYIRLIILSNIEDGNDNSFINDTIIFRTEDTTPPVINNTVLSSSNNSCILTFNENIYSTNSGNGVLDISDFTITYNSNSGNCINASIVGLTNNDGNPLEEGESIIQVSLQLDGAPSGVETFLLSPSNSSSIFDLGGNAMSSSSSSLELMLFASALLENFSIADSNEYVDLTFSVGIYGDENQVQPVSLNDLNLQLYINDGPLSSGSLTNIKNTNNDPLLGGEETIRIFMSFDTLPSGVENIIISPNTGSSIYSLSGVPIPSSENTGFIQLVDQRPPEVEQGVSNGEVGFVENEPLRITFSENIHNPVTGELISSEDLLNYITLRSGDSLGMDIPFLIDYSNPPDLYIIPNEDFSSEEVIYYSFNGLLEDEAGNPIIMDYEVTFTIRDYLPPSVDSSDLAPDNSYLDLIFDDGIFGAVEFDGISFLGITPVDRNDFAIEFQSNGSETDSVEITSITRTDSNFLIGGENQIRINFEYNGSPSGNETLRILVQQGITMYDEVGNQMTDTTTITDEVHLYDILAPTISSVSVPIDSFITLMEDRPITFTFNEKIDSLTFEISSIASDTVHFDSSITDSSIEIILKPPFTSFDQITVDFTYIEDNAGLSTVDIAYTYRTPMLGDYDFDNSITYNDLWDLVENWEISNMDYEIGPISGEVPHVIPILDSKFDIEDGMAFVQMWSWYQQDYGEIIEDSIQVGRPLIINQNDEKYTIIIDSSVFAGQLKFSYPIETNPIEFLEYPNKNNSMFIKNHLSNKGFSILEFARQGIINNDSIIIKIQNSSKVNLFYSFESSKDSLVRKGMSVLNNAILPDKIKLYPAYPNPFNPTTNITFDVPNSTESSLVSLGIYDVRGREISSIVKSYMNPGVYSYQWNGSQCSSGMYITKLRIGSKQQTQKIILLK